MAMVTMAIYLSCSTALITNLNYMHKIEQTSIGALGGISHSPEQRKHAETVLIKPQIV